MFFWNAIWEPERENKENFNFRVFYLQAAQYILYTNGLK